MKTVESNFTIKTPVRLANPGGEFWRIHDAKGLMIVDEINIKHRAESIALALNAYPALLEACRAALELISDYTYPDGTADPDSEELKEQLRSAIAQALATNNSTKE